MASAKSSPPPRPAAASHSHAPVISQTTTRTFTFPKYSKKAAQLPPGEPLRSKAFDFHGRSWRVKLYPRGYTPATRDFVAVFVKCRSQLFVFYHDEVTVEILDKKGEGTVFDDATANTTALVQGDDGFSKGYVKLARRREVAASACVRDDDSVTVRLTLRIDAEVSPLSVLPWRRSSKAVVDDGGGKAPKPSPSSSSSSSIKGFAPDSKIDTDDAPSTSTGVPEIVTGSYTFTVSRFSEKAVLLSRGECLRSTQFLVGGSNWYIKVYPNGHNARSKDDSVSFYLARGRSGEPETTAEFAFEVVNLKEADSSSCSCSNKSAKVRATFGNSKANSSQHLGFQLAKAVLRSSPQMRPDRLVIRCNLGVFRGKPPSPLLAEAPAIAAAPPDTRSSDFFWLLNSQEGADVTIAAGGTTFRAHSCILAARSAVFREEVRELVDNPEKNPWRYINVEEEEMSAQAFEALLHVVYTDQLPDMSHVDPTEETVAAMVFAAERYAVERLKLRCEQWLCSLVTPLTVADILSMAVRYDLRLLEDACVKYASPDHVWDHVKGTQGFNLLRASCPHIVREIESKQRKY